MWLVRSKKAAGGLFGFQNATSKPAGKEGTYSMTFDASWRKHLGKQGCNYRFHNHEIFNSCKSRPVNVRPLVFVHVKLHQFCISSASLFICYYSSSRQFFRICIHQFCSVISNLLLFLFCSNCSFDYLLFVYSSVIFCSDTGNVLQIFWSP